LKRSLKRSGKSRADAGAAWRARDRACVWHPFTQQKLWEEEEFPVIARAKGCWLEDVDGRRYLDGVSSLWCNVLGHGRREVVAAMKRQLDLVAHATYLGLSNPPSIELAERLLAIAPKGLARVFYSDNGSTAVEVALKMAFQYWRQNGRPHRTKFVRLDAAYHGDTVGTMSVGGIDLYHGAYRPLFFPTIQAPSTYAYRCPEGGPHEDCGRHCLDAVERILKVHERSVAGLVLEPVVQGAGGMIPQPPGFLAELRRLCDRHDVFLIADEVMTGFGRTGRMFACEHDGVTPDFLCLSKGLTGGLLPLAATLTTDRVYRGFLGGIREGRTFYHGHTYTGNPLACAAALAVLDVFRKDRVIDKLKMKIHRLGNLLQDFYTMERVGDVRQSGFVAGVELVRDPETREPFPAELRVGHQVTLEARRRGVITRPLGNTLVVLPPLTVSERELETLVGVLVESTREVLGRVN
jgi:adenosylmethionine-8-amino-7-oxononanoate aminotransferase